MNSEIIISLLEEDSIKSLFSLEIPEEGKKDYIINKNFIIIQLKEIKNSDKVIYVAILRDKISKYNGFLFSEINQKENLQNNTLIKIEMITPRITSMNPSRVFIIKKYNIIYENININNLPEAKLIKDDNNEIINNNNNNDFQMYTSLKQLTTFSRDFIIYVRILKKSTIKIFNSNNNINNPNKHTGKLFTFIVLDKDENEMQCTCFNKAADKFFNIITEGKIYEIKGGYVKINDKKFTTIKSDYKIVLDENSIITEKKDDGRIKSNNLKIVKISEIQNLNLYSVIDLCATVLEIGEITIKHTRNGEQPMKKIIIGDISKYKIEFSLWRNHSSIEVNINDILLINNAKVGEFNGRNLSTFDDTSIQINPSISIKEVLELSDFIKNFKGEYNELMYFYEYSQSKNKETDNYDISYMKDTLDSIDVIEDSSFINKICVTVTQIIHNEKNYYLGCCDRNCKKKLIYEEEKNIYICPLCGKNYNNPHCYFTLSLRVKDASCEHWIDIFDKTAESILKITAEEYKNILKERNESKLKEISNLIEFKQFYFWVKPKFHMYNSVSKKKLYAYKIEPVDIKNNSKKIIKYIKNILKIHY